MAIGPIGSDNGCVSVEMPDHVFGVVNGIETDHALKFTASVRWTLGTEGDFLSKKLFDDAFFCRRIVVVAFTRSRIAHLMLNQSAIAFVWSERLARARWQSARMFCRHLLRRNGAISIELNQHKALQR
jgi:hypothetical protein